MQALRLPRKAAPQHQARSGRRRQHQVDAAGNPHSSSTA
jgi:hypothetical protein